MRFIPQRSVFKRDKKEIADHLYLESLAEMSQTSETKDFEASGRLNHRFHRGHRWIKIWIMLFFICVYLSDLTEYWHQAVRPCPLRSHCG